MFFHIEHTTEYVYSEPATESFSELRLRPRDNPRQRVSRHATLVEPKVLVESYTDYFGNFVETLSVPFRHNKLVVTSLCEVETRAFADALPLLDLTISEARLLYASRRRELHDFLQPSFYIPFGPAIRDLSRQLLRSQQSFAEALQTLNRHIFTNYKYKPGATDVRTSVPKFLETGEGVCQDFAHLMIGLCRIAGIPARYVSGYIETHPPGTTRDEGGLIGSAASHAWVEIFSPNGYWVGFDPTNDIVEGERHVQIGIGRDYHDVPPLQGIFKGRRQQALSVQVRVTRSEETTSSPQAGLSAHVTEN